MARVTCPVCLKQTTIPSLIEHLHGGYFDCTECGEILVAEPDRPTRIKSEQNGGPWKGGWLVRRASNE